MLTNGIWCTGCCCGCSGSCSWCIVLSKVCVERSDVLY
jgi:hypothetical protein